MKPIQVGQALFSAQQGHSLRTKNRLKQPFGGKNRRAQANTTRRLARSGGYSAEARA